MNSNYCSIFKFNSIFKSWPVFSTSKARGFCLGSLLKLWEFMFRLWNVVAKTCSYLQNHDWFSSSCLFREQLSNCQIDDMALKKGYLFAVLLLLNGQVQQSFCCPMLIAVAVGGIIKLTSRSGANVGGLQLQEEVTNLDYIYYVD